MKLTRTHLKQLILEEMKLMKENEQEQGQEQGQEAKATLRDLQNDLKILAKNMAGVEANEIEIYKTLINLLQKVKNDKTGGATQFKQRLALVIQAAEKIV